MSELRSLEYVAFDEGRSRPAICQGSASAALSQAKPYRLWPISIASCTSGKTAGTTSEPQRPMAKAFFR
jgi:hypothetical protein